MATFQIVDRDRFRTGAWQSLLFAALAGCLIAALFTRSDLAFGSIDGLLEPYGLAVVATTLASLLVVSALYGRLLRRLGGIGATVVVGASAMLLPVLAFLAEPYAIWAIASDMNYSSGMPWQAIVTHWIRFVFALWFAAVFVRSLAIAYWSHVPRALLLSLAPMLAIMVPQYVVYFAWDSDSSAEAALEDEETSDVDVERTFYAQPDLLDRAAAALAPERPGTTDLYFLGFAGYGSQNVFRSEVEKVTALFDARFDTSGRSLMLINSADTTKRTPIASASNLERAIPFVASRMNRDEDILFLFLTSHGSPGLLSVEFWPLRLNDLSVEDLDRMLDASGIKWRVVIVSACYSGSFIAPLQDDNTLIVTAASADRKSFGCSNENEYTYFGDAYFNNALRHEFSFVSAFEQAAASISERESAEDLTPSQPQIYVGPAIVPKLRELERRLDAVHAAAGSTASDAAN
ncbi:MAG: C13 family peptidase [Dongiaceae bacterium]